MAISVVSATTITRKKGGTGLASLYRSASSRCTAAKSGSSHSPVKAPRLPSRFRSSLSGRWRLHEQRILVVEDQRDSCRLITALECRDLIWHHALAATLASDTGS